MVNARSSGRRNSPVRRRASKLFRRRAVAARDFSRASPATHRNPALFLFLEAVGVLAGERLDQRGFAVIDMAGGADDGMGDGVASNSGGHGATKSLLRGPPRQKG